MEDITLKDVLNKVETATALMQKDISYIREKVDVLEGSIAKNYVTISDFKPVRAIVYGFTGLVLTSFMGAVIALVIKA